MTKVVFQSLYYWLAKYFWQEAKDAGVEPMRIELRNGVVVTRTITRDEFAVRSNRRVAGWSYSAAKSVSVFMGSLSPEKRATLIRTFQGAIQVGIKEVVGRFSARTGAQGKVRLPAELGFTIVIHVEAKNGAPQLHAHIAIDPRVRVRGRSETYATHTRELYQIRKLFHAATNHEFASRLQKDFGVQVKKTAHSVRLPGVPKSLCKLSSGRAQQIDAFLVKHHIKNSPLARRLAALATRRDNVDRRAGQDAFQAALQHSGFRGESICQQVKHDPKVDVQNTSMDKLIQAVAREARRYSHGVKAFSEMELLVRVLEKAETKHPVFQLANATLVVLQSPTHFGLRQTADAHGKPIFSTNNHRQQWKPIRDQVEYIFAEQDSPKAAPKLEHRHNSSSQRDRETAGPTQTNDYGHAQADHRAESSDSKADWSRIIDKVIRSYQVVGAIGQVGLQVAAKTVELYQVWAKPIWRVNGYGHKNTPGSVAAMVRDLKKMSIFASHEAAILAMLKLNGSIAQKIRYGEHVFRQSRKPKFRIPKKALIIVRDVEEANPKDLQFIMAKAKRARAKILLVEREWSRSVLVQQAKTMRAGECRRVQRPEQSP